MDDKMQTNTGITSLSHRSAASREKSGAGGPRASRGASSVSGKGAIRTGSPLVVASSFQAFLAEEQAALRNADRRGSAATVPVASQGAAMHVLQKGETVWDLARERYGVDPATVLRCNNIADPAKLRAGQAIRLPVGKRCGDGNRQEKVVASWYGTQHHGKMMANGQRFDMHAATIAHRSMPIGTRVELENPRTGQKARAVVTDRGPFHKGRDIDLSYGLAKKLSLANKGIGVLKMRVL
ncbi:septal ring lytic transglycosylase RlpA family protein [Desulfobulbus elongatus]|uniref:septal ring lytic transglycosylase RlpA family protein n=1 Tax=Desulfobulbus elongatus TaxID=53332 RepID=UPI000686C325|nr:septal ring lytic transglycosylase RlpA family protein [Desulfobulbus elongatus]